MGDGVNTSKVDLLHPLATLHWEHRHRFKYSYTPVHCAVLNDRVVLLVQDYFGDVLLISSIDLQSWTEETLHYNNISLATYQSKFVAVGGHVFRHSECTNLLFTSDTGIEWQPSLPPMPTKRSHTSSVSIKSPEVLVVAGGINSDGRKLDVVEVLVGDQWSTVDPLPAPYSGKQCILHDGYLYIWENMKFTVYTCSYASLISSSGKSNDATTTIKQLHVWRQFKALRTISALFSYSFRLVSIYMDDTIKAYSSVSQSWVEVSSAGERSKTFDIFACFGAAAAVLPTGELVIARQDLHEAHVYRVKLSVSLFEPDNRFNSDVLSKLEDVMGIQIRSALANIHSRLAVASGVKLKVQVDKYGKKIPLPNPDIDPGQYVEEVIFQWSAGNSNHPPTWKYLLEILQDIGLLELSQQINMYMKGPVRYVDAYQYFINTKDTLELLFLKFVFLGPPRLGKTTVRRRLMGEITDLKSAGEAEQAQPSTGAVESGHSMIVKSLSNNTTVITQAEWSRVASLTDEARMLFHNFVDSVEARNIPMDIPHSRITNTSVGEATPAHRTDQVHLLEETPKLNLADKFISKLTALTTRRKHTQVHEAIALSKPTIKPRDIPEVAALFREVAQNPEFWNDVKRSFKAYLRMEDTGGQPELMDMLPALTIGPGLYLLFFSYECKLKSEFKVFYQRSSGESTLPEPSIFTLEEMLLSSLSSIYCSNASANLLSGEETSSSNMREILDHSKSVAYIVGTHKDKVSEEYIASFDEELQRIIRDTDFFKNNLVQFCSKAKLVISMDNMEGGAEEISEVRKLLERAMEKHFKKLKIPAIWLLFSLCLRMRDVRTASKEDCLELSSLFDMSPYETKVALWFLHHHAGVMMYFPSVPGLEDLVIIDIQVVYDSVTNLILRAMSFDNVGLATAEKFRRTGQFILKDLIATTAGVSGDLIAPVKLVALLEYLHIVARISDAQLSLCSSDVEDKVIYIMPCVLRSASKDALDAFYKDASHLQFLAPLMVRYKCGFVPIGVFPAVIASLIANSSFQLIEKGMMKNLVQFHYGSLLTLVTFVCWPKYYGIFISALPVIKHEPHKECATIRREVESTFERVSSHMNYGYFMDYQFAFECPSHPGREHLCVVDQKESSPKLMLCLQDLTSKIPVELSGCHKVWYGESLDYICQTSMADSVEAKGSQKNSLQSSDIKSYDYVMKLPTSVHHHMDNMVDDTDLFNIADHMLDWVRLSPLLQLSRIEVHDIEHDFSQAKRQRQEALQLWRQKLSINATYGDLLRVCCNGNDMQTADVIFEVLQSKSD